MATSDLLNAVRDANAAYETAAKALVAATAAAFPVGTEVLVTLGNARVRGRVMGTHDCWWHEPSMVTIENLRTGKRRKFCPTSNWINLVVISEAGH